MKNIRSESNAEAMAEILELLGCDKEFLLEKASDFERFCTCVSALDLLEGSEASEKFVLNLEQILGRKICADGLTSADAAKLWIEYNEKEYGAEYTRLSDEYYNCSDLLPRKLLCEEKNNNMPLPVCLNGLLENQPNELLKNADILDKCRKFGVYADFSNAEFCRPNRYAAEEILKRTVSGEKLNNYEINTVLSQFVIEIIYSKKCEKIQLYLELNGNAEYVKSFVEYLGFRHLSARIYLCVNTGIEPNVIVDICRRGGETCFITPILECGEKDGGDYLKKLAKIYPIALIKSIKKIQFCGEICTTEF